MAVTATPVFVQAPKLLGVVAVSTANTNRDGTGTLGTVFSGSTNGDKVEHVDIQATGTTTAGVIRLYLFNGSTSFLWKEILVDAITPSTTIKAWSYTIDCSVPENCMFIQSGYGLKVSTHNAETFNVSAHGGSY